MESIKELNVYPQSNGVTIDQRTGKLPDLPPIPAPKPYKFFGVLSAVGDFLKFRKPIINGQLAIVTIDRNALTIIAETNPNTDLNDVVTGKIELNPDLVKFQINKVGPNFTRETMVGLLRTMRQYFPDKEAHMQLLSTVKNLQVKVNINAGRNEDTRGNKSNNYDKTVAAENVPVNTLIEIPIFVGEPAVRLQLDICYDTSDANVFFWFESTELAEAVYNNSNGRMTQERARIEEMGYLVLEK